MQIFGIILNYVNITHIWLTKPLSEGVCFIWTLPSYYITKNIKENKGDFKNGKERISKRNCRKN